MVKVRKASGMEEHAKDPYLCGHARLEDERQTEAL